ncbi:TetR/AcrR family transcriptional regulator [Ruegeria sp.]|uniref:TetR/AcrR family transcriptional regulator n=1 Tax=Ruegeria sp. TaxID=1879320 RepID=UPI003C7CC751
MTAKPKKQAPTSKKRPGRPTAKASAARRSTFVELLENALTLFSLRGYDGVSTTEIARDSGVAQSMIHYHFGSKLDIWKAAIEHNMKERGRQMQLNAPELVDLDPSSRLRVLIRKFLIVSARDTRFTRLVMIEGVSKGERLDWLCDEFLSEGFKVFADCIEAGIARGQFRDQPVHILVNLIMSLCAQPFCAQPTIMNLFNVDMNDPAEISSMQDAVCNLIFDGICVKA